jgi:hypothetical protein
MCFVFVITLAILSGAWVESSASYNRPTPQYVIPPDWEGSWQCAVDGRTYTLRMQLMPKCTPSGGEVTCTGEHITGSTSTRTTFTERRLDSGDPATTRTDHMLPVQAADGTRGLYLMHTWDHDRFSGYGYWSGAPYPVHCTRVR